MTTTEDKTPEPGLLAHYRPVGIAAVAAAMMMVAPATSARSSR